MEYRLIRSSKRKKTISLIISRDGEMIVRSPLKTPVGDIENFLKSKNQWIEKKLQIKQPVIKDKREFTEGEFFLYLGDKYPIVFVYGNKRNDIELKEKRFLIPRGIQKYARELFIAWYKKTAKELIFNRSIFYQKQLALIPSDIKITSALSRYGSCSARNSLSFSWRLIMAPLDVIDYVIIHEFCHIKEKNHSPRFWRLVESIIPDYKVRRRWLKDNGHLLRL